MQEQFLIEYEVNVISVQGQRKKDKQLSPASTVSGMLVIFYISVERCK